MARSSGLQSPTNSILAPVDFEPAARAALQFAAQLAQDAGVPLTILHVVHEPADRPNYYRRHGGSEVLLPMEVLAERRLDEFLTGVRSQHPDLVTLDEPGVLLVKGLPGTRIPEVAERMGAAQIVMGRSRGRRLLPGLFAPLSDRVADQCDIPVTLVHPDGSPEVYGQRPQRPFNDKAVLGA